MEKMHKKEGVRFYDESKNKNRKEMVRVDV